MNSVLEEIVGEVENGRCVLFLGSGSTVSCESPSGGGVTGDGLTQAMVRFLGEDPATFRTSLGEASEFLEAHRPEHRKVLDDFIHDRLHDLRPTIAHQLLTLLPWQAIVTTNFNLAIERGYEFANNNQLSTTTCVPFRTDAELSSRAVSSNQMALFKPHGCLSIRYNSDAPMVLTAKDYYHSMKKRRQIYDHIAALAGEFSTLFVGYSLNDYNFNNLYYELQETLREYLSRSYSVTPVPKNQAVYLRRVYERRDISLIDDKFDTFMISLVQAASRFSPEARRVTIEELIRPNVVQQLGSYAENLPADIKAELMAKGVVI
jgi:hypothetical protein